MIGPSEALSVAAEPSGGLNSSKEGESPKGTAGSSRGTTPYTKPQWMDNLRQHFLNLIVEKCSQVTRNSVNDNIDIQVCMLLF
jgi:hypothetical protein